MCAGMHNLYNPNNRHDNCVSCVAACLKHRITGEFCTADVLDSRLNITERLKGSPSKEDAMHKAIDLIAEATGLQVKLSPLNRQLCDPREPKTLTEGHYAVFILGGGGSSSRSLVRETEMVTYHVIYGRVGEGESKIGTLFDPQSSADRRYGDLVPPTYAVRYGPADRA